MNKALLYSIAPQHVLNILNGLKTIEVRKRDLPQWAKDKLAKGEKVVGYGYCTKEKPYLFTSYATNEDGYTYIDGYNLTNLLYEPGILNGLVVVKFEVSFVNHLPSEHMDWLNKDSSVLKHSCLTLEQLLDYGNGADLYAHHLTNITPIDPMGLGEFYKERNSVHTFSDELLSKGLGTVQLTKAPQSFQSVWVKGE